MCCTIPQKTPCHISWLTKLGLGWLFQLTLPGHPPCCLIHCPCTPAFVCGHCTKIWIALSSICICKYIAQFRTNPFPILLQLGEAPLKVILVSPIMAGLMIGKNWPSQVTGAPSPVLVLQLNMVTHPRHLKLNEYMLVCVTPEAHDLAAEHPQVKHDSILHT